MTIIYCDSVFDNKIIEPVYEEEQKSAINAGFNFSLISFEELTDGNISTVSNCTNCKPSENWLGLSSPKQKIKDSGLWLVNELWKQSLSENELTELKRII